MLCEFHLGDKNDKIPAEDEVQDKLETTICFKVTGSYLLNPAWSHLKEVLFKLQ